jgi:type VI protein secretion system component VasK
MVRWPQGTNPAFDALSTAVGDADTTALEFQGPWSFLQACLGNSSKQASGEAIHPPMDSAPRETFFSQQVQTGLQGSHAVANK